MMTRGNEPARTVNEVLDSTLKNLQDRLERATGVAEDFEERAQDLSAQAAIYRNEATQLAKVISLVKGLSNREERDTES
jgi:hypothetical protein